MTIKRKLTEVAVDAFTDYLKEKLDYLKQFDLDQDGVKDVDQLMTILSRCGALAKEAVKTTNFPQIAAGLDQIISGAALIGGAVEKEKLGAVTRELAQGLAKAGELARLSIEYVKNQE